MNDYTINPLDTVTWLPSHNSRRDTTACGRLLVHVVPSGVAEKARATQAIALIRSASWARARRTPRWCSTVMSRSRGANAVRRRSFRLSIALRSAQRASSAYPTIACFFVDKGYRRRGVAAVALHGALDLISQAGGGAVEAYPKTCRARKPLRPSFMTEAATVRAGRVRVPTTEGQEP